MREAPAQTELRPTFAEGFPRQARQPAIQVTAYGVSTLSPVALGRAPLRLLPSRKSAHSSGAFLRTSVSIVSIYNPQAGSNRDDCAAQGIQTVPMWHRQKYLEIGKGSAMEFRQANTE